MGRIFTALRIPAITVDILLVPFVIYFIHVRSQKEYFINRNFRVLATLSNQIRSKVNTFQSVIGSAAAQGKGFKFGEFLNAQELKCVEPKCENETIDQTKISKRPLSVVVERDEDVTWLHFTYHSTPVIERRIKLAKEIIEPFLRPVEGIFDDVVIADYKDGQVIYQQSQSGFRFTEVKSFLMKDDSKDVNEINNERDQQNINCNRRYA